MNRRCVRTPREGGVQKIQGYVTVQPDNHGNSDDDESDDDDDKWLDDGQMSALALNGTLVKNNSAKLRRVTIKAFGSNEKGKSFVCKGRFPLYDPWWKITCHIYCSNNPIVYCVDHTRPILYEIRTDDLVVQHNLMNHFLTTVQTPFKNNEARDLWDGQLKSFSNFIRDNSVESVYFENLEKLVQKFDASAEKYLSTPIWPYISGIESVKVVLAAIKYTELFTFLGELRPRQFLDIFKNLSGVHLNNLEKCRQTYPWEYGFSTIMYNQYGLMGIEASLTDFSRCDLLTDMPTVYKDSLFIYDFLKRDARENGHTYIEKFRIRKSKLFNDYLVVNWEHSLKYLEENIVIKTEGTDRNMKIFLKRNWQAEKDIVKNLGSLIKNTGDMDTWDVDFSSEGFDNLHGDEDQWKAAHLITSNPVAVLSGKGGCGKTTVVTQLLKHVCQKSQLKSKFHEELATQGNDAGNKIHEENDFSSCHDTTANQSTQFCKSPWQCHEMTDSASQLMSSESSDEDSDDEDVHYLSKTPIGQSILLTAPTGKAANLLGRKTNMESFTLHHVLMSCKAWCKRKAEYLKEKNKERFHDDEMTEQNSTEEQSEEKKTCGESRRFFQQVNQFQNESNGENELTENQDRNLRQEKQDDVKWLTTNPDMPRWKFEFKSVLVVDECSLVSVCTISTVLNNLKRHSALKKVILLGDVRQLPSIEPGNFLCDIFRVLYPLGCCMELRTNHRAESEIIIGNATKISEMKLPMFDGERFQLKEVKANEGDVETDTEIKKLLQTAPDLQQETSQFVCFQRRRCESINELCCKYYNNHVTRDERGKYMFQVGDKVCMSTNAEVINFRNRLPKKAKRSERKQRKHLGTQLSRQRPHSLQNKFHAALELAMMDSVDESCLQSNEVETAERKKKIRKNKTVRLCNGEVFFILQDMAVIENDGKSRRFITLSDKEQPKEKIVCVDYRDLTKKCKMRHGWARTIHTYQGSESTAVVYVVYKTYYENWQHVYTAVTRGRNSVYMVGKKCNVEKAIRTDKKERRTSLKEKLMTKVEKFPEILQQHKEELENLLQKSYEMRQQNLDNRASGEVDLFDSEDSDDNENYIDALCNLLPTSQSPKMGNNTVSIEGDNSEEFHKHFHKAVVNGRPEHNVLKTEEVLVSEKGDNSDSNENSLMFDSDDSYMKTLDESELIFGSQMTQFTQYQDEHGSTKDESFDDSPYKQTITCDWSPDLRNPEIPSNLIKRQLSDCGDATSPQKAQRIFDSSISVSPVRRSLEQTLAVTKTKK